MFDPIFSFYLSDDLDIHGKVILGGYDVEKYAKPGLTKDDIIWTELTNKNDYFWTLVLNQLARFYGGSPSTKDSIFSNLKISSKYIIMDTGLSYALAPMKDIIMIAKALN